MILPFAGQDAPVDMLLTQPPHSFPWKWEMFWSGLLSTIFSGFPTIFKELVKPCELQLENTSQ